MAQWSTKEIRRQAAGMTMENSMDRSMVMELAPAERRLVLKEAKAQRYSGISRYPTAMLEVSEGLLTALDENELLDMWDSMDYRQQGAMYLAFKVGYDLGRSDNR